MAFRYTEQHRREYVTDGLTVLRGLIPTALLEDLRRETDKARVLARRKGGPQAQRLQPVFAYQDLDHQPFHDFLELPVLREAVDNILSPGHRRRHVMGVLLEPEQNAWCTAWHRDTQGLNGGNVSPEDIANPLLFNQFNAALYDDHSFWVVPGSHNRPDTTQESALFPTRPVPPPALADDLTPTQREMACLAYTRQMPNAVQIVLCAGDVAFYRQTAWHIGNYVPYVKRATLHDGFISEADMVIKGEAIRKIEEAVVGARGGMMSSLDKILYDELTWPEINEAVEAQKVLLLPIGSTEQHGHHLPLDVDNFLARSVCLAAARRAPREMLVMPTIPYGYNEHAIDFPGTIHVTYEHFIAYCLDVCKSVAHAGFKRIIIIDGHGSNEHLCEFIARRATLETDALVASTLWINLAVEAFEAVRESGVGGAGHACELETSAYLYLEPSRVQMDKAQDHFGGATGGPGSRFVWVDLTKGWGPMKVVRWTSSATPHGVSGTPTLATREKGQATIEGAADNLHAFVREFRVMPKGERVDHRVAKVPVPPRW